MNIDLENDERSRDLYAEVTGEFANDIDLRIYGEMARRFAAEGDLERAGAAAERVVELDPKSARAHFEHAKLLLEAGRWRDGGRELEVCSDLDAVELAGRHWADNNLYYIAYALFNVGRYKEAAEAFQGAQRLIDTWVDPLVLKRFHWHTGMAFHLEGKYLDAAEYYRRAMVAPGPGDSNPADTMDEDEVEASQDLNDEIEEYMSLARQGKTLELDDAVIEPSFR